MKKLVFPKNLFVRHAEKDFKDDGATFRMYYYKDVLPISAYNSKTYGTFVDIRLDYVGIFWNKWKADYAIVEEFNGCEEFNMEKFIENCEYICKKYIWKSGEDC